LLCQLLIPRGNALKNIQDKWKSLKKLLIQSGKPLRKKINMVEEEYNIFSTKEVGKEITSGEGWS
jgi:hypothetical protein